MGTSLLDLCCVELALLSGPAGVLMGMSVDSLGTPCRARLSWEMLIYQEDALGIPWQPND